MTKQARSAHETLETMAAQNLILEKSVAVSEKSASAALQSASALEKLERPFLMLELRGTNDKFKDEIWLVNKGKVPAQILWFNPQGSIRIQTREEMEAMPPVEEFYYGFLHDNETAKVLNVPWIAPEGEMRLTSFDWVSLRDEMKLASEKLKHFYLLSTVKYRGMLSEKVYESRWCVRWFGINFGGLRLDGPPGYNDYT
jgi:hypothetical protein